MTPLLSKEGASGLGLRNPPSAQCHERAAASRAMLIEVKSDGPLTEFSILELQGELHTDAASEAAGSSGDLRVGTLSAHPTNADVLFLQIGYHRLEGRRVALKKPLAVLRRAAERQVAPAAADGATDDGGGAVPAAPAGYRVQGVVRSKVLFDKRPKALITNPNRA